MFIFQFLFGGTNQQIEYSCEYKNLHSAVIWIVWGIIVMLLKCEQSRIVTIPMCLFMMEYVDIEFGNTQFPR